MKEMMYRFEEFFFNESVGILMDLTKMLAIVFVVGHWMACLFTATARSDSSFDNWIIHAGLQGKDQFTSQYLTALYWSFMTMTTVGYGDITPISSNEKIVTILMMVISCAIFAWIMGKIGSLIAISDAVTRELKECKSAINSFMFANKVENKLRKKVVRYLDHVMEYKS